MSKVVPIHSTERAVARLEGCVGGGFAGRVSAGRPETSISRPREHIREIGRRGGMAYYRKRLAEKP